MSHLSATSLLLALTLSTMPTGCVKGGGFLRQSGESKSNVDLVANTASGISGVDSAIFKANSSEQQTFAVSSDSPIAGTSINFQAGSLSVNTQITFEEGISLATAGLGAELGIGNALLNSGAAVSVQSSVQTDASKPFTLNIPLPPDAGLAIASDKIIQVVYKATIAGEDRTVAGIIARSDVQIEGNTAKFSTKYFGVYQAVVTKTSIAAIVIDASTPILTKRQVANLPPIAVLSRSPVVIGAEQEIVIMGKNFRSTMTLAFNSKKVSNMRVLSDSTASFTVPAQEGFGMVNLSVEQDGTSQNISLFYKGLAGETPIITEAETEVCAGKKYYDAAGTLRVGSKVCSGPDLSNLKAANIKTGVTIAGVTGTLSEVTALNCVTNGEIGCLTTATLKAADFSTITAGNIKSGVTVGGVTGQYPSSTYPLAGTDSYSDLTNPTFYAQIKSASTFGWFDRAGTRYSTTGSSNISASNISTGISIFGATGTLNGSPNCTSDGQTSCLTNASFPSVDVTNFSPYDIRGGKYVGAVPGALFFSKNNAKVRQAKTGKGECDVGKQS